MLSLAGVPPTAGFFGKLALFSAAIDSGRTAIVVVAALASAAGAYYYLRVLVLMIMRPAVAEEPRLSSPWLSAALWACACVTLLVGILPEWTLAFARRVLTGWPG